MKYYCPYFTKIKITTSFLQYTPSAKRCYARNVKFNRLSYILTFIGILLLTNFSYAQWAWIKGSNQSGANADYGIKGIPNSTNTPQGIYTTPSWNDNNGNTWIYSAFRASSSCMWHYSAPTNTWTWLSGDSITTGPVYGVKGVSSPLNHPGSTSTMGVTWIDLNGDLWLLGGKDASCMWKYSIAINQWAWMSGSNVSTAINYGVQNVPSPLNNPGPRIESSVSWTDASGNFWLIGGAAPSGTLHADVWMYDPVLLLWVWKGGLKLPDTFPEYGTKGVSAAMNNPGGRQFFGNWLDAAGNCYFFGGFNHNYAQVYTDLWKYDPVANFFTWISGSDLTDQPGNYGTACEASANNYPASRYENRYTTKDHCGNFWMFGGFIGYKSGTIDPECINDLWKYNPSTNEWTWVSGSNIPGSTGTYGTQGISHPNNMPPAMGGGFLNCYKGFYLGIGFGSNGGYHNNVWRYDPPPTADFTTSYLPGSCAIQFNDKSTPECGGDLKNWLWEFGDGNTSSLQNPTHQYAANGTYTVTLVVKNCLNITDTVKLPVISNGNIITTISSTPDACLKGTGTATVTVNGTGNYTYHWTPTGSTSNTISQLSPGLYIFVITDKTSGCSKTDTVKVLAGDTVSIKHFSIQPTCTTPGSATTIITGGTPPFTYLWSNGQTTASVSGLQAGTYTCEVTDAKGCTDTTVVTLVNPAAPALSLNSVDALCFGSSTGSVTTVVSGGTSPYTYLWSNSQSSANLYNIPAGTYTLILSDAAACTLTKTITVHQPAPVIININSNATTCGLANGTALVSCTGGTPPYNYLWWPGSATTNNLTNLAAGNYTIYIQDSKSCKDSSSVSIAQSTSVQADFSLDTTHGCLPLCVNFKNLSSPPTAIVSWNFGDGATGTGNIPKHCYTKPGNFTVTLMASSPGCNDTLTLKNLITVAPLPLSSFTYLSNELGEVVFTNQSTGAQYWNWNFGDTGTSTDQNPTHTFDFLNDNGEYLVSLIVSDAKQLCKDTAYQKLKIREFGLYIPNSFTPNGDGLNDVFLCKGYGIKEIKMAIYNRWGVLLFENNTTPLAWDGTYNNSKAQEDTYIYVIIATTYTNTEYRKTGTIHLIR